MARQFLPPAQQALPGQPRRSAVMSPQTIEATAFYRIPRMAWGLQLAERIYSAERMSVPRVETSVKPSNLGLAGRNRAPAADREPPSDPFSALLEGTDKIPTRDRSHAQATARTATRSTGETRADSPVPQLRQNADAADSADTPDPQQAASPDEPAADQAAGTEAEAQPADDQVANIAATDASVLALPADGMTGQPTLTDQPAPTAAPLPAAAVAAAQPDAAAAAVDLLASERAGAADAGLGAQAPGAQAPGAPAPGAPAPGAQAPGAQAPGAQAPDAPAQTGAQVAVPAPVQAAAPADGKSGAKTGAKTGAKAAGDAANGSGSQAIAAAQAAGNTTGSAKADGAASQSDGEPAHAEGKPAPVEPSPAGRRDTAMPAADGSSAPARSETNAGDVVFSSKLSVDGLHLGSLQHAFDRQLTAGVASTGGAAASTAQAVPIEGLAVEIAARSQAGHNRFEIRLDPPELGRIDVRLDIDRSGHVTSRLVVERAETLDLLRRDAPELERALQQAGLKTSDNGLQFALRDQGFSGGGDDRPEPDAASATGPDAELEPIGTVPGGYGRTLRLGGGVDIRV